MKLRIGSRKSELAKTQAQWVAEKLTKARPDVEVEWVWITTSGDRFRDRQLAEIGGKGLFLKEIESALLDGEIDLAIHSGKDIPAEIPAELVLAATPERGDHADVLCYRDADRRHSGRIGTGSLRRGFQAKDRFGDAVEIVPIRGNVGTRLGKIDTGEVDAVILAAAGLERLNWPWDGDNERLSWMIPATAQGTLVLETRENDHEIRELLSAVHDRSTWICYQAERGAQVAIGGDCFVPFGVHATLLGTQLQIRAGLWSQDGSQYEVQEAEGAAADAWELGSEVGRRLREAMLRFGTS